MTADTTDDAPSQAPPKVVAAGGVVLDDATGPLRVLVVHRPAHDDWSLPKGHVDPDEQIVDAALREVVEETGVRVHVTGEAGATEHTVTVMRAGAPRDAIKRVHWFTMRPVDSAADPADRAGDSEVDTAAWWTVERALTDLSYVGERQLLARILDVRMNGTGSGEADR